ncbi:hypothetical protein [Cardinium endosymbiont of Sogatella furcifera]|uniref:hypothetical protein n=1 Tax=Cardinium endosymbiont of Sogatella furcifera TaxID=650378 RepID=UPI000E0DA53F|nr:hypothetical protein [Cardinium endosymbiont of Sogatella furcifera]
MFTRTVYLLYLLILGGCSHTMHQHGIPNGMQPNSRDSCCFASRRATDKNEQAMERIFQEQYPTVKEELSDYFLYYARYLKETPVHKKNPVNTFREKMETMLPNHFNIKANDYTYDYLGYQGIKIFSIDINNQLSNVINNNIPDNLINNLLSHTYTEYNMKYGVSKHAKQYAKMLADAMAETAINAVLFILQRPSNTTLLASP